MCARERIIDTMIEPDEKLGVVRYQGENIRSICIAFSRIGKTVFARSVISARHHGDEAMKKVGELIVEKSQQIDQPIIHQEEPWNDASEAMLQRSGYVRKGKDRRTRFRVYEKKYP